MDMLREVSRREERFRKLQEEYRGVQVLAQRRRQDMSQRQSRRSSSSHPVDISDAETSDAAQCCEETCNVPPDLCTATEQRNHDANQDPAMLDFILKQLEILQRDKAQLAEEKLQLEIENRNLHSMLDIKNMSFETTDDGEAADAAATTSGCNSPQLSQRL